MVEDLAARFITAGFFTAVEKDVFLGLKARVPAGAGPYLTMNETSGGPPTEIHSRVGNPYLNLSAQLIVLCDNSTAARAKAQALWGDLVGVRNTTIGAYWYLWIRPVQSKPFELPVDGQGRARYAFNINVRNVPL